MRFCSTTPTLYLFNYVAVARGEHPSFANEDTTAKHWVIEIDRPRVFHRILNGVAVDNSGQISASGKVKGFL